jgi:Ran GTPase-activating protein (RanGAP) involved in mRNA processing and transport
MAGADSKLFTLFAPTLSFPTMTTTPKRNNFAVNLADWERTLVSINAPTDHVKRWNPPVYGKQLHAPTDHVYTRWNPPATQHYQSATTMTTPNIAVARNITHTPTVTHSVTKITPQETLQHDGVLVGEQHNAGVAPVVTPSQCDNAPVNDSKIERGERDECINRSRKALRDEDLDEIIKEMETNSALSEIKLSNNLMTLADGRFATALASNTSIQNISLHDNNISDEGVRSMASALKNNNTLRCINLSGNTISKAGAQYLAEALMVNTSLDKIYLQSNKIGDEGVRSLAGSLKNNNTLVYIFLCGNQISKVGAKFLADALMVNTKLESINLNGNMIGDGVKSLAKALKVNKTLKRINLSGCKISEVDAQFLAEALMVSTSLVVISLSNNKIGDAGVQRLCAALQVNSTLKSIDLNGNKISKVGARFLAEALMINTSLDNIYLQFNNVGNKVGMQRLCAALKVTKTLKSIDLCGCRVSKVGAKFLADALMVNRSLLSINLSSNNIDDEGAQCLAESFTMNQSLQNIQLSRNEITDVGATQLADAIEFNCDCVLTTIGLKGNQVSAGLLDRIESISKAKQSSKGKELSSNDILTATHEARDGKHECKLQIVDTIASRNKIRKLQINGTTTSKDDQIASLKEHIALLEEDIAHLNEILRHTKPIVETIDLTTDEDERATKRSRTESDVKSNLAIMYEHNQKIVQIKQENVATQLANHTVMSTFKELREDLEDAHAILHAQTQRVIHIKKEKMDTEMALESIRGEKNNVETELKVVKEDLEDANELVGQMSLTTDIWQGRFDELVALMQSGHADGASINAIRNRPLGSGK